MVKLLPRRTRWGIKRKAKQLKLRKSPTFCGNWHLKVRSPRVKELSEGQRGYLAGIIDGEGTVSLHKAYGTKSGHFPHATVSIGNTNLPALRKIKETIGTGNINIKHRPKYKPVWEFSIRAMVDVKVLLNQVKDFLIIKKKLASLVLKFIELRTNASAPPFREMERIYEEVRQINKRGAPYIIPASSRSPRRSAS